MAERQSRSAPFLMGADLTSPNSNCHRILPAISGVNPLNHTRSTECRGGSTRPPDKSDVCHDVAQCAFEHAQATVRVCQRTTIRVLPIVASRLLTHAVELASHLRAGLQVLKGVLVTEMDGFASPIVSKKRTLKAYQSDRGRRHVELPTSQDAHTNSKEPTIESIADNSHRRSGVRDSGG